MNSKILYFCLPLIGFFFFPQLTAASIDGESAFGGFMGENSSKYWQCASEETQEKILWEKKGKNLRQGKIRDISIYSNKKVEAFVNLYTYKKREAFMKGVRRSAGYMKMIRRILKEYKLPLDLAYLPVVESNFNPDARSKAGAVGLWQFMAGTGKMYGLQKSWWHDDRYDPEKSTVAAARYLRHLIKKFDGQWELALAAYNCGEKKVENAVKKARRRNKPTDFWSLSLPRETRGYVPAFLAAVIMFHDPKAHGFETPSVLVDEEPKQIIKVTGGVFLEEIGRSLNISVQTLKRMNPALRKGDVTPLGHRKYALAIPARARLSDKQKKIAALQKVRYKGWRFYRVSKEETLSSISKRHQSPIDDMALFNPGIKNKESLKGGQTIILPIPADWKIAAKNRHRKKKFVSYSRGAKGNDRVILRKKAKANTALVHKVKEDDTLRHISLKYNISIQQILTLNPSLKRKGLKAGSRIMLEPSNESMSGMYY